MERTTPHFTSFFCLILLVRVSGAPYAFNQPLSLSLFSSLTHTHTPLSSLSLSLVHFAISHFSQLEISSSKKTAVASVRAVVRPNHSFAARCAADGRVGTPISSRPAVNRVVGSCDYRKNIEWVHILDIIFPSLQ